MSRQAKFICRISGYYVPPELPDASIKISLEWKRLNGARTSGKCIILVTDCVSTGRMEDDVLDRLAEVLSLNFAPEHITARDIIGPV
jgi:hypothetical protein